jgi:hypothetical protein
MICRFRQHYLDLLTCCGGAIFTGFLGCSGRIQKHRAGASKMAQKVISDEN